MCETTCIFISSKLHGFRYIPGFCPAFSTTMLPAAAELAEWLQVRQYFQASVYAIALNLASFERPNIARTHTATLAFL